MELLGQPSTVATRPIRGLRAEAPAWAVQAFLHSAPPVRNRSRTPIYGRLVYGAGVILQHSGLKMMEIVHKHARMESHGIFFGCNFFELKKRIGL